MKTTVNERIKLVIDREGMNINSFSKKIEISQPTLKAIIDGRTKPSFDTIEKICIVFSISPNWLILEEGEIKRDRACEKENLEVDNRSELMMKTIIDLSGQLALLKERNRELEENSNGYIQVAEQCQKYGG